MKRRSKKAEQFIDEAMLAVDTIIRLVPRKEQRAALEDVIDYAREKLETEAG